MRIPSWQKRPVVEAIPLSVAVVCEDCKNITKSKNSTCGCCGSKAIWSVSAMLQRATTTKLEELFLKL